MESEPFAPLRMRHPGCFVQDDLIVCAGVEQGLGDAVDDQVGIAADGRGEVRVVRGGEGEVAFVLLGVARLLERAQHEVARMRSSGLPSIFVCQALIHLRRDGDVFGNLVLARRGVLPVAVAGVVGAKLAALALELHALDRQAPRPSE